MVRVIDRYGERVREHGRCGFKAHAVLAAIRLGLFWIPAEMESKGRHELRSCLVVSHTFERIERLLEQLAEWHSACIGHLVETLNGFRGCLDVDLLIAAGLEATPRCASNGGLGRLTTRKPRGLRDLLDLSDLLGSRAARGFRRER